MRFLNSYYLLLQMVVFLCGAEVAKSCLKCFTTPADRASICHHAVSLDKMGAEECLQRLHWGFDPLNNITIGKYHLLLFLIAPLCYLYYRYHVRI